MMKCFILTHSHAKFNSVPITQVVWEIRSQLTFMVCFLSHIACKQCIDVDYFYRHHT